LTLSGGGSRATLFHLGVIRFLYEEKLLHQVTHICSVSGGSVLAAHLVLNWDRYTGDETAFNEAAEEVAAFTRSDLRGRIVRGWLFSWAALGLPRLLGRGRWTRTRLLENGYRRLYGQNTLHDLQGNLDGGPPRPELHLLATSLTSGHLVSFGRGEMRFHCMPEPNQFPASGLPVAFAVAASSAFPPLFAPVRVSSATLGAPRGLLPNDHYLSDGGVFDNLGIRKLLWLNQEEKISFDLVVVSDGQRASGLEFGKDYRYVWDRASRSADLLMDRVSRFETESIDALRQEAQSELLAAPWL
jgi:predicted acylesterase/phospholipase RssA